MRTLVYLILIAFSLQLTVPAFWSKPCTQSAEQAEKAVIGSCCKGKTTKASTCDLPQGEQDEKEEHSDSHLCLCTWSHLTAVPTFGPFCACTTPPIYSPLNVSATVLIDQLVTEPPFHPPKVVVS